MLETLAKSVGQSGAGWRRNKQKGLSVEAIQKGPWRDLYGKGKLVQEL